MRRLAALAALAGVSLFACMDTDPTMPGQQPATPTASILDGAHGGNAHFFFLPPLAPDPRANGEFNAGLAPVVEICALADGGEACADPQPDGLPFRFTMEGSGPESVRLEEDDEQYAVNWQTGRHGLDEAVDYRIRVFPVDGGTELGHLDVDLVAPGGRARRGGGRPTPDGDLRTARLGSTLPIRFRIEQGITCMETDDCVEVVVGTAGGIVVAPSGFGGATIPQGALDAPVLISVERVDVSTQPCLPGPLFQAEGCFRFDTDPSLSAVQASGLDEFNLDVGVGVCLDPDVLALPEHHQYALHKHDPDRPDLGIVQLPSAPVDFLECSDFTALATADGGPFMNLARTGWERVAPLVRWLGPRDLYAINLGFGGLTKSFSNIGWARGLDFTVLAGDGQTGAAGSTLPVDPAVRVTATHWDPDDGAVPPPVQGVPVAFSFTDPAGTVTVAIDTTDANGLASVPWTLGPAAGTNTLTVAGATSGAVSLSAQGVSVGVIGRIAFVSSRDGSSDIHVMNADGSERTNLTNNPATDWSPSWSPDGTEIAFSSSRDGNAEIYVMNADGSGQTRLTNHPANESHTAWSPDGTRIAFTSDRDGNTEIYVMNADGSGQTRLTNHIAIDNEPTWSPDGTRIAFTSHRTGDSEIHVMNADGTALTNLTPDAPGLNDLPDWSPDGTKIVFHSSRSGSDLWVMNADGSVLTNLTNSPLGFSGLNYYPAWSPDGTQIAFGSNRDGNHDIYVMNADGSGQTNLTNDAAVDSDPAWQPVGGDGDGVADGVILESITAGGAFTCGLTADGTAYCWGDNGRGQLGDGTNEPSLTPVRVGGTDPGLQFDVIAAGDGHVCGIDDGSTYCWGWNADGQLGVGDILNHSFPQEVSGLPPMRSISLGLTHTCAISTSDVLYCWGDNEFDALGAGTDAARSTTPLVAVGHLQFSSVSAGVWHTCGIDMAGGGHCWGRSSEGQLGSATPTGTSPVPLPVDVGAPISAINAGIWATCAVTTAGGAYCWGFNDFGALGDGTFESRTTPTAVNSSQSFTSVEIERQNSILGFTCGLTTAGAAYCWGSNQAGQLGVGAAAGDTCSLSLEFPFACSNTPLHVAGTWRALAVGLQHVCALTPDDELYCWGANAAGQFGDGTTEPSDVPRLVVLSKP